MLPNTRERLRVGQRPLYLGIASVAVARVKRCRGAHLLRVLARLMREDAGQDVVEYALLGAFIGLSGAAALSLISTNLSASYLTWDSGVQNIWQMPAPTGS